MQRYILFLLLSIVSVTVNCEQKYMSKLADEALKRHDYLTDILDPEQCRAFCDSMDQMGVELNEPTLIYASEHIKYLLSMANDSSEAKTMLHLTKCKNAAFEAEDSAGGFDMWCNEVVMKITYGHHADAQEDAQNLIDGAKKSHKSNRIVMAYFTMSNVKSSTMDFTAALHYAKMCAQIALQNKNENKSLIGDIGILMSTICTDLYKWDDVIAWADTTIKYDPNYREAYYLKAHGYLELGDNVKFRESYNKGEEMGRRGIPCVQSEFLPYYHAIAMAEKGDMSGAMAILNSTHNRTIANDLKRCFLLLKGDYKGAYYQTISNFITQDSIRNNDTFIDLDYVIGQLEASEKARKYEAEKQRQKFLFSIIFSIIMLVIILCGILIVLRFQRLNNKMKITLRKLDISNRKNVKANEQLELASDFREDSIKQLANKIRADVNQIKGFADLLAVGANEMSPEEIEESKKSIETGYESINQYLHEMDESSRESNLNEETMLSLYKVNDLARQAIKEEWARPWEDCPVDFETEIDEDCMLYTDYYRLKTVLRRAIHYIYVYGNVERIRVKCTLDAAKKMAIYTMSQAQSQLPTEISSSLFDRYFIYNNKKEEGLYITRKLANTVDATMWYEKNPEKGESIKVSAPLKSIHPDPSA